MNEDHIYFCISHSNQINAFDCHINAFVLQNKINAFVLQNKKRIYGKPW